MTTDTKTAQSSSKKQHIEQQSASPAKRRLATLPFVVTFFIMMIFWLVFSGRFDLFHLAMGIFSSLLVAFVSNNLLFPDGLNPDFIICWFRFTWYIPWLLYQILLANLRVLRLAFHPRMMDLIDPNIIEFNSRLDSDIARTTFSNSITLTPGTITINVSVMGRFTVHCIDVASGKPLPGEMERRIARVFKE